MSSEFALTTEYSKKYFSLPLAKATLRTLNVAQSPSFETRLLPFPISICNFVKRSGSICAIIFCLSRPTWCLIHVFTSHWLHMHLSSLLRRPTMNSSVWLRSLMPALSLPIRWWSVTLVMASIWPAAYCIEVMLYQRMSTLPLLPSRLRGPFSL